VDQQNKKLNVRQGTHSQKTGKMRLGKYSNRWYVPILCQDATYLTYVDVTDGVLLQEHTKYGPSSHSTCPFS